MPSPRIAAQRTPKGPSSALLLGAFGVLCAVACGSGDHTVPNGDADASDGGASDGAQVDSLVNVCPYFEGSLVMPQRIRPDEAALITVRAVDPDASNALLTFEWRAASGSFNPSDKPVTTYRCSRLGIEPLTVSARDRQGCLSELSVPVDCIAN